MLFYGVNGNLHTDPEQLKRVDLGKSQDLREILAPKPGTFKVENIEGVVTKAASTGKTGVNKCLER